MKKKLEISQSIIFVLTLVILFGVPLYMNTSFHDAFILSKFVFFRFLIALMLPFSVYAILYHGNKNNYFNGLTISAIVFWILWVIASVFSKCWQISKPELIETTTYIIAYILWSFSLQIEKIDIYLKATAFSAFFVAGYSLLQHLGFDFWGIAFWNNPGLIQTRSISTMGNPTYLAGYLAMALPIVLYLFLSNNAMTNALNTKGIKTIKTKIPMKIFYAFIWMICILSLILTYSRGAWLAAVISLIIMIILMGKNFLRNNGKTFTIIILMLAICLVISFLYEHHINTRFTMLERVKQATLQDTGFGFAGGRLSLWKIALMMIYRHPIHGIGPGMFSYEYLNYREYEPVFKRAGNEFMGAPHNEFIGIALSNGIPCLCAYLAMLAFFITFGMKLYKNAEGNNKILWSSIFSSCLAYQIHLLFLFRTVSTEVLWWFLLAVMTLERQSLQNMQRQNLNIYNKSIKEKINKPNPKKSKMFTAIIILSVIAALMLEISTIKIALASYYANLGKIYESQSKGQESGYYYDKAISYEPDDTIYYLMKGAMLEKWFSAEPANSLIGNEAIKTYQKALCIFLGDPYNWANIGRVYGVFAKSSGDLGKFEEAVRAYKKAIDIDKCNYKFYDELGTLYASRNILGEAEICFNKGLEVNPKSPQLNYNLAVVMSKKGEFVSARKLVDQALILDPSYEMAKKLKDLLESAEKDKK